MVSTGIRKNDIDFENMILCIFKEGQGYVYCKACRKSVKISASGRLNVLRLVQSEAHKRTVAKAKQHIPFDQRFQWHAEKNNSARCVTRLRCTFCRFLADHN